jgi:RNA polymerase sigma factor (sigma-70 family)
MGERSDKKLLARAARGDEHAFAALYARYERPLAAFFVRSIGRADLAADLTAETFAEVVTSLGRFDPARGGGAAWLFGMARNVLARSRERRRVEDRARRRLAIPVLMLDDESLERIEALSGDGAALELLAELPELEQGAVRARVIDERSYDEIAAELECSESVVRKRVSRGLAKLRSQLKEVER